ncbi:MAG: hypothetical protein U0Q55_09715 [Vicinamibacterales bacterium]
MALSLKRTAIFYAAALAVASPALAQQAANNAAPQADGQKVATDANGRIRAITPEEAQALIEAVAPSISQSGDGLTPVRLPNGMLQLDLQGRFEAATLATIGPDGTVAAECVTSVDEAKAFLGLAEPTPAVATPVLEER